MTFSSTSFGQRPPSSSPPHLSSLLLLLLLQHLALVQPSQRGCLPHAAIKPPYLKKRNKTSWLFPGVSGTWLQWKRLLPPFLPPTLQEKRFPASDLQHLGTRSLANPHLLPHTRANTHANTRAVPLHVLPLRTSPRAGCRGLSSSPPTAPILPRAALVPGSPLISPADPDSYHPTFPRIAGMGFPLILDEYSYFSHDSGSGKQFSF